VRSHAPQMARIEAAKLERAAQREAEDEAERKATAAEKERERRHVWDLSGRSSDLTFDPFLVGRRSRAVLRGDSAGACAPPLWSL
jgi:hypothetical protein